MTVAVISQKGGSGKTTLAMHLASAAFAAGHKAIVFDLDPMATASHWSKIRRESEPRVICGAAEGVTSLQDLQDVADLTRGADFVVIDSATHDREALLEARGIDMVLTNITGVCDCSRQVNTTVN